VFVVADNQLGIPFEGTSFMASKQIFIRRLGSPIFLPIFHLVRGIPTPSEKYEFVNGKDYPIHYGK
jgi:hypothetical protein